MNKELTDRTNTKVFKMTEEERLKALIINPLHYIQLKEKGYTDKQIAESWGLSLKDLVKKANHWKFIGIKPSSMRKILNRETSKRHREIMQENIDEATMAEAPGEQSEKTEEASTMKEDEKVTIEEEPEHEEADPAEELTSGEVLQETINELKEHIKTLKQENGDLAEENQRLSQVKEGISIDYEKLQKEHAELWKRFEIIDTDYNPKQMDYLLEERLRETYRDLEAARLECKEYAEANQKLQFEKETWTNKYIDERYRHEALAAYTNRLMPL